MFSKRRIKRRERARVRGSGAQHLLAASCACADSPREEEEEEEGKVKEKEKERAPKRNRPKRRTTMDGSDLRDLIAQSQPSVVLSRARASLRSPSRPSTPLELARTTADVAAWDSREAFGESGDVDRQQTRRSKSSRSRSSLQTSVSCAQAKAENKDAEHDESLSSSLVESTGHGALAALKHTIIRMRELGDAVCVPDAAWEQIDQTCALSRAGPEAARGVHEVCYELLPVLLSCAELASASLESRLSAARMIACLCAVPSFVEIHFEHVKSMTRIVCDAAAVEASRDKVFRDARLLESLVQFVIPAYSDMLDSDRRAVQPLLFVVCALKNVCAENADNQAALARYGAISLLSDVIRTASVIVLSHDQRSTYASEEKGVGTDFRTDREQVLIGEVAAVLRTLVDDKRRLQQFASANVAANLCACLRCERLNESLVLNAARLVSRLSMSGRIRGNLDCGALLGALETCHTTQAAAAVRLCFALGNLTTELPRTRLAVADWQAGKGVEIAVRVLCHHGTQYVMRPSSFSRKDRKEQEDLLIKAVRLVANLAIEQEIGERLAHNANLGAAVAGLLRGLLESHSEELTSKQEELALNLIACATNLSFYCTSLSSDEIARNELFGPTVVQDLLPFVFAENAEAVQEAVRALANYSRLPTMRQIMVKSRAAEAIILLLEHCDREVVLSATGALTNLIAEPHVCSLLERLEGVSILVGRLRQGGVSDAELSLRCSMALYNLASQHASALANEIDLLKNTLEQLVDVAHELVDESSVRGFEETKGQTKPEDEALLAFAKVGKRLQDLLENY